MSARRIVLRAKARADVDQAISFYLSNSAAKAAMDFIGALETTYAQMVEYPAAGSPRFGVMLGLEGLRSLKVNRFPYLVFYMDGAQAIDVFRALHTSRDITADVLGEEE